jgi:hypothetical protein
VVHNFRGKFSNKPSFPYLCPLKTLKIHEKLRDGIHFKSRFV